MDLRKVVTRKITFSQVYKSKTTVRTLGKRDKCNRVVSKKTVFWVGFGFRFENPFAT